MKQRKHSGTGSEGGWGQEVEPVLWCFRPDLGSVFWHWLFKGLVQGSWCPPQHSGLHGHELDLVQLPEGLWSQQSSKAHCGLLGRIPWPCISPNSPLLPQKLPSLPCSLAMASSWSSHFSSPPIMMADLKSRQTGEVGGAQQIRNFCFFLWVLPLSTAADSSCCQAALWLLQNFCGCPPPHPGGPTPPGETGVSGMLPCLRDKVSGLHMQLLPTVSTVAVSLGRTFEGSAFY